jgi:hypothetical protein
MRKGRLRNSRKSAYISGQRTFHHQPEKTVAEWKLHGITCYDGHPVREPLEALPSDPIALDGDPL